MIIAVEEGLEKISRQLAERGYTIVHYPEYKGTVDALIYKNDMISNINQYNNSVMVESLKNNSIYPSPGVLVVNGNNKNVSEIEEILTKRIYSSLF